MPVIREGGMGRASFGGIAAVGRGQNMLEEHEVEISPEEEPPLPVLPQAILISTHWPPCYYVRHVISRPLLKCTLHYFCTCVGHFRPTAPFPGLLTSAGAHNYNQ